MIFHLVAPGEWPDCAEYRAASLDSEGFVHFSFAEQVAGSANRHYADAPELVAVEVDPSLLDAELRVEDSYGSGTAFPHVYGPIPSGAAIATHPLHRDDHGRWTFTPGADAAGRASSDR